MIDTMIQNTNDQAKKIKTHHCVLLWCQAKRSKGFARPKSPNPSSNKNKKNVTRQKKSKTHHSVLLWCQTKRGNALSTRGKGSAVMIMQIASHRIH